MKKASPKADQFAAIATEIVSESRDGMELPEKVAPPSNELPLTPGNRGKKRPLSRKILKGRTGCRTCFA